MIDIREALDDILTDYTSDLKMEADKVLKKGAKKLANKISEDSPEDSGRYKKGWKSSKNLLNELDTNYTVYQSKKPSLTHLLENGHVGIDGKRVKGIPHINDNADDVIEDTIQEMESKIKELSR